MNTQEEKMVECIFQDDDCQGEVLVLSNHPQMSTCKAHDNVNNDTPEELQEYIKEHKEKKFFEEISDELFDLYEDENDDTLHSIMDIACVQLYRLFHERCKKNGIKFNGETIRKFRGIIENHMNDCIEVNYNCIVEHPSGSVFVDMPIDE